MYFIFSTLRQSYTIGDANIHKKKQFVRLRDDFFINNLNVKHKKIILHQHTKIHNSYELINHFTPPTIPPILPLPVHFNGISTL